MIPNIKENVVQDSEKKGKDNKNPLPMPKFDKNENSASIHR